MTNLYKISYIENESVGIPTVQFVKAKKKSEALSIGLPEHSNGEEKNISQICIETICEMDEIQNLVPSSGN